MGTQDSRSVREKGPPNLRRPSAFYSDDYTALHRSHTTVASNSSSHPSTRLHLPYISVGSP